MSITPGTRLGPYEVTARLGAGGMGEVFRAHDARIGRDVAIKVLPPAFASNEDRLRRFEQEARTAGGLNHPHLVTIYDIGRENGASYIVMELLDGATLRDRLASGSDLKKNLLGLADAADAVAAAHHAGVVHRDLKPENIMVSSSGFTKVLDFGLAKLAAEAQQSAEADAPTAVQQTGSGVVLGTVGYMSPEQAMGKAADNRSDIFALGCILYEVVTGQRAFAGKSSVDTLHDIIHNDPPPVRTLRPDVAPELQRIIRKCLAKDPDERYQSAKDLAIDLRAAVRELASGSDVHAAAAQTPRRNPLLWIAIAILIAAVAAAAAWLATRRRGAAAARTITIRQLTTSGDVISAAISPDGKYLAFANSSEGRQGLFLRQIGTEQTIPLVPPLRGGMWGHTFTKDGSAIVYGVKSQTQGEAAGVMYQIATLGGSPRRLLEGIDSLASFAPDGARFAYLRADFPKPGQSAVMIANSDGGNPHPLAVKTAPDLFAPVFFGAPAWSPDGKVIVTSEIRSTGNERGKFVVLDAATGAEKPLTNDTWRYATQSVWLPDGSGLIGVAANLAETTGRLYRVDYPSGETHLITTDVNDWRNPSLTADGKQLVAIGANRYSTIVTISPGGGAPRRISPTQVDGINGVAFLADGRLVFTTFSGSGVVLVVANADGSNRQQLELDTTLVREPAGAPDGGFVCLAADRNGIGIWRMSADGRHRVRLAEATASSVPAVARDGSRVYFNANLGNGDIIYAVPLAGGAARPVSTVQAVNPAPSPDGRQLGAFITTAGKPPHLAILEVSSGAVLREFEKSVLATASRIHWSADGKTVYYNAGPSLFAVPAAGGEPREIAHYASPNSIYRFDVARDGTLALVYGLLSRDAYLITGFE